MPSVKYYTKFLTSDMHSTWGSASQTPCDARSRVGTHLSKLWSLWPLLRDYCMPSYVYCLFLPFPRTLVSRYVTGLYTSWTKGWSLSDCLSATSASLLWLALNQGRKPGYRYLKQNLNRTTWLTLYISFASTVARLQYLKLLQTYHRIRLSGAHSLFSTHCLLGACCLLDKICLDPR